MRPLFIGDVTEGLVARLKKIAIDNGYRTDAGHEVSEGYVTDVTGAYLNDEVYGDSLVVQTDQIHRQKTEGILSLMVFGLTKDPAVSRLHKLEDDIYRALRDADFHREVKEVKFSAANFGAAEKGNFFGVSVPVRIQFTHSLI
ncbi:hypothetical protein ACJJJB_00050 (plasmid) [Microbulbifer sp. ANSA001]|uniref:hypothetical protein n=1 Tax=Microbulbifer sp. ANSA001 TaxID=3243358 RepID=UPI0040411070